MMEAEDMAVVKQKRPDGVPPLTRLEMIAHDCLDDNDMDVLQLQAAVERRGYGKHEISVLYGACLHLEKNGLAEKKRWAFRRNAGKKHAVGGQRVDGKTLLLLERAVYDSLDDRNYMTAGQVRDSVLKAGHGAHGYEDIYAAADSLEQNGLIHQRRTVFRRAPGAANGAERAAEAPAGDWAAEQQAADKTRKADNVAKRMKASGDARKTAARHTRAELEAMGNVKIMNMRISDHTAPKTLKMIKSILKKRGWAV